MPARVAVVTVTYSPGEHLEAFLASLPGAGAAGVPVIMVDNGSVDGAPEAAALAYPDAHLVRSGGNIGFGAACNRGLAEVAVLAPDAEFVVIANPDIKFTPGSIEALAAAADRWPRAGAVGPLVREPDGSVYPSARSVPDLTTGIGHALLGRIWPGNRWTRRYRQDGIAPSERTVGWLSGSCLMVRRSAFDSIDGFDSRYFMYMEDVDLGDRLGRAGWRNIYAPTAVVIHDRGHAAGRVPAAMVAAHHQSAYRFQADRHPGALRAPLRLALRAGLAVRGAFAVRAASRGREY